MDNQDFFTGDFFNWVVLPLIIFFSRLFDVTLGTLRHIFLARGFHKVVPILGFLEVFIWILVIGQIMKNINNIACYIGWAGGFAFGNWVGMKIDEKLAFGLQVLRIITPQNCDELIMNLQKANLGVTIIDGKGSKGPVKIIFTIIKRKDLNAVSNLIEKFNPNAFYSVEDIREASQGVFPTSKSTGYFNRMFDNRK